MHDVYTGGEYSIYRVKCLSAVPTFGTSMELLRFEKRAELVVLFNRTIVHLLS